jgi:hypothetical protein
MVTQTTEGQIVLTDKQKQTVIRALDRLALGLKDHTWTNEERRLYERAIAVLTP